MNIRRNNRGFLPALDALDRRVVPSVYTAPPAEYDAPPAATTPSQDALLYPAPTCYNPTTIAPLPPGWTPSNPTGVPSSGPTYSPSYNPTVIQPPTSSMTY